MINVWGPSIIVCLTVVIGIIYNNKRIDDINKRFDDLYRYLDAKFKSIEDRLDKLENQKLVK